MEIAAHAMRVGTATPSLYLVLKISQVSKLQDEHNASFHMSGKSRLNPNTKLDKSSLFHPFDTFSRAAFGSHCNLFLTVRPVAHPEATPLFLQTGRPGDLFRANSRFECRAAPGLPRGGEASGPPDSDESAFSVQLSPLLRPNGSRESPPPRAAHPSGVFGAAYTLYPLAANRLFRKVLQESKSLKSRRATAAPSDESLNMPAHHYITPARRPSAPPPKARPLTALPAVGAEPESRLSTALPRPGRAPAPTTAT